MFAMLLAFGFTATALVALVSIGHSLKQGLSAFGALRSELEGCSDARMLTVWSASTGSAAQAPGESVRDVRPVERFSRQPA